MEKNLKFVFHVRHCHVDQQNCHPRLFENFRHVPHAGLLGKLEHYGIDSKILLWITNFLNNRKQRVVVDYYN